MTQPVFITRSTHHNIANMLPISTPTAAGDRMPSLGSATAKRQGWGDSALGPLRLLS
jgi:hypothetical protein